MIPVTRNDAYGETRSSRSASELSAEDAREQPMELRVAKRAKMPWCPQQHISRARQPAAIRNLRIERTED